MFIPARSALRRYPRWGARLVHCRNTRLRNLSTGSSQDPLKVIAQNYSNPASFATEYFGRVFKYSLVGLFTLGVTLGTAFEAAHFYVENVALAAETDPDVRKWEWDLQGDRWSPHGSGGTEPALGLRCRHAVRGAWMAENWGTGSGESVIGAPNSSSTPNVVDSATQSAQDFLKIAINIAMTNRANGSNISEDTLRILITRHATLLESLGYKDSLLEARSELERMWKAFPPPGVEASQIAQRLGDLNRRLGNFDDAVVWWTRAVQLAEGKEPTTRIPLVVPTSAPSSPLAQRSLISTLVSVSAFYATTGQLEKAQEIETSSLDLIRSIKQPESFSSSSPGEALHALYVLHRSAILSIHLAEVQHGLRSSAKTSIQWLTNAAESSERIAFALSEATQRASRREAPLSIIARSPVVTSYSESTSMRRPASSLLRDSRRSAAEAWHLIGLLTEGPQSGNPSKAAEYYGRALGWIGVDAEKLDEGVLPQVDEEWTPLLKNYIRVKSVSSRTT
jgi:tetratricopeptide (TPR) repeat protein